MACRWAASARSPPGKIGAPITLDIYPDEIRYIPANVRAHIRATTSFSAKFVDLVYPTDPSRKPLAAGTVIKAESVGTEANNMFANLVKIWIRWTRRSSTAC